MTEKTCGNCVQCEKYTSNGKEVWSCENSFEACGMPVDCTPPHDAACRNWSDNPEDKDKPEEELRDFVDHFWDEDDDDWEDD